MGGPCTVDGKTRHELDNFHQCQFQMDGEVWPTSEHYYQACKFPEDPNQRERIRTAASGMEAWKLGQACREMRDDWEEVKVEMMYRANLAKFQQNAHLRDVLVQSQGPIFAQGSVDCWKTWNEVLLERIREELRDYDRCNSKILLERVAAMDAYRAAAKAKDQYAMKVATQYAAKRMPIPKLGKDSAALIVTGVSEDLDGVYQLDLLRPEANGQPHYSRHQGGHLALGVKHGRSAWVIDESFSADEASGQAFIAASGECHLPLGQSSWQCFDGSRHVGRIVSILKQ